MTKKEIAKNIKGKIGMTEKKANEFVDMVFGEIIGALLEHDTVTIPRFGVFEPRRMTGRNSRNPKTGESVDCPAFLRPWFRGSRDLKNKMNGRNFG